ncbi:MAG TPA: type I methionyl aminopeptidase [Patescibacteria group bacterium]|nr:type I methionyl aminopeptidase [Patescibacteria group bacterium]
MITIKSPEEITKLKRGGSILASILRELKVFVLENYQNSDLTTADVNAKSDELMAKYGVLPAFPTAGFPTGLCISVNDEVVHGVPGSRILKEGDIVSLDLGVICEKLFTDASISFILGKGSKIDTDLVEATYKSLMKGIEQVRSGATIGDIGYAIERHAFDNGFGIVREYCGHGVGYSVHEPPSIPNYGKKNSGDILKSGMILAIEPMLVIGEEGVFVDKNNKWTVKTKDGGNSAHWEHTVVVTDKGSMILTG